VGGVTFLRNAFSLLSSDSLVILLVSLDSLGGSESERLGFSKLNHYNHLHATHHSNKLTQEEKKTEVDGTMGVVLGVFQGLMYQTAAKGGSACFGSLAGQIGAYDSFG
jgi:hypothetical protein